VLSEAGWTEAGLRDLIMAELAPHVAGSSPNTTVNGPPVMLKPQAALFLALVIHELSTNAAKYGSLSVADGSVEVAWGITDGGPQRLELSWTERGGPRIDDLPSRGFGSELIERGIRFELEGEAKLDTSTGALHCTIVIPAKPEYLTFGLLPESERARDAAS
jgi:two-component sensor histidine kinase